MLCVRFEPSALRVATLVVQHRKPLDQKYNEINYHGHQNTLKLLTSLNI